MSSPAVTVLPPVTGISGISAYARARARVGINRENPVTPGNAVTLLRHCRCLDCRKFSKVGGDYFCSEYIGGTSVVWVTGQRVCDPPPDAWHYCACYDGPQISRDVWVWPRSKKEPAPGGGRPGGGLEVSNRPGGNRSTGAHPTPTGPGVSNADVTAPVAAQVGAGSNIPAGSDDASAFRRDATCADPRGPVPSPRTTRKTATGTVARPFFVGCR